MQVFPAVAELRPVNVTSAALATSLASRIKCKEAAADGAEIHSPRLQPVAVRRVDEEPINGLHSQQPKCSEQGQPECARSRGRKQKQDDGCDESCGFRCATALP